MDEAAVIAQVRKAGLVYASSDATVRVGMGGDGEFYLEWLKDGTVEKQEEFYDDDSLVSAMKKIAALDAWKPGAGR